MKFFKNILLTSMLCSLLLISPFGVSATHKSINSQPLPFSTNSAIGGDHYVTTTLLSLDQNTMVTSHGTYTVTYIPVQDHRLTGVSSSPKTNIKTLGKVRLKLDQQNQLLDVILY